MQLKPNFDRNTGQGNNAAILTPGTGSRIAGVIIPLLRTILIPVPKGPVIVTFI